MGVLGGHAFCVGPGGVLAGDAFSYERGTPVCTWPRRTIPRPVRKVWRPGVASISTQVRQLSKMSLIVKDKLTDFLGS